MRKLFGASLLIVILARPAGAQDMVGGNVDLEAFRPAIDSRGFVTVNASQILGHKDLSFGLVTTWGFRVLELEKDGMRYTVENLVTPTLQAAFGLFGVAEVGVTAPFHVMSGDFTGQGIGDVGLHAKVRLLDTSRHAVGVAVVGSVFVPAHDEGSWLGEDRTSFLPSLVVDKELGRTRVAANVGYRHRPERIFMTSGMSMTAGSEIPFGLAASYALVPGKFEVIGEVYGGAPLAGQSYFPLEAVGGIKLYLAKSSFFTLGGGAGSADARAFVGIVFEPSIGDRDGDGLKDDVDRCPDDPEDFDDYEDLDGCPELDNDRDRLSDDVDRCPNEPEDLDGVDDEDGCPDPDELDRDGDRIRDDVDGCPDDPEDIDQHQDRDGCPDPDNDGDRILDVDDLCPNEPEDFDRVDDQDGCPERDKITRTKGSIDVLDNIYFETDSAVIKLESYGLLDAIADSVRGWPDIRLLEVQGHADERGAHDYNLRLTQARAESVVRYLVGKGIEARRLRARGFGETRPRDPGHTEGAWSQNRRVEFVILEQ
jgi:OmpA-OmpF porin, OOP family